jgi:predicted ester cyclase
MTTTNKELALDLSRAIMKGDWARVDALLDDSFVYVGDGRPALDKQGYVAFMRDVLCTAMGDMDMSFTRVVGEGDLVAVEYANAMTHKGAFLGIPATGKRVVATGHFIREVKGGKITGEWQTTNAMGLMAQLGAGPSK